MFFGWLNIVDFRFIISSTKDDTLKDMPAPRCPFFKLASLAQHLHILVPPLGRAVQAASVCM